MYQYLSVLSYVLRQNPERMDDIANSLSATQVKSKQWLVSELAKHINKPNPKILILGGWYGSLLVPLLNNQINPSKIILTDIDPKTVKISSQLHKLQTNVECWVLDGDSSLKQFDADVVINTSCEHMQTFGQNTTDNKNCLFVLQSCDNVNDPGHINTAIDTEEFVSKLNLSRVYFKGRMDLGHKNRFMAIGLK